MTSLSALTSCFAPDNMFRTRQVLTASDLNERFSTVVDQAALRAAAPNAPGLFRPWWWPHPANVVAYSKVTHKLTVKAVFAMSRTGRPLFVEEKAVPVRTDARAICVTPEGEVEAHPLNATHSDDTIVLARLHHKTFEPELAAPVADLTATEELSRSNDQASRIARDWYDRLVARAIPEEGALGEVFVTIARGGTVVSARLALLLEAAAAINNIMKQNGMQDRDLICLARPFSGDEYHEIFERLHNWAHILSSSGLLERFFGRRDWLYPAAAMKDAGMGRKNRFVFKLEETAVAPIEVFASDPLTQCRWSRAPGDRWHTFPPPRRHPGGWITNIDPNGAISLYVETNAAELRLRPLRTADDV